MGSSGEGVAILPQRRLLAIITIIIALSTEAEQYGFTTFLNCTHTLEPSLGVACEVPSSLRPVDLVGRRAYVELNGHSTVEVWRKSTHVSSLPRNVQIIATDLPHSSLSVFNDVFIASENEDDSIPWGCLFSFQLSPEVVQRLGGRSESHDAVISDGTFTMAAPNGVPSPSSAVDWVTPTECGQTWPDQGGFTTTIFGDTDYESFRAQILPEIGRVGARLRAALPAHLGPENLGHYALLHHLLHYGEALKQRPGLWLEFGVFQGTSVRMMAEATGREVFGFDSFDGLPENWHASAPAGAFALAQPPELPPNVHLVVGLFNESLPRFLSQRGGEAVSFLHADADLYSSTDTVLRALEDVLMPGTMLLFDELVNYPGYEQHELLALWELLSRTGRGVEVVGHMGHNTPLHNPEEAPAGFHSVAMLLC